MPPRISPPVRATLLAAVALSCHRLFPDQPFVPGWKRGAPSPVTRVEASAGAIGGRLYLFGGSDTRNPGVSRRVDVYDPGADAWSRAADLPYDATHVAAAVDGERAFVAGGYQGPQPGPPLRDVFVYDAARDAWGPGPPLPEARAGGALVRVGRQLHYVGGYADRVASSGSHWALDLDAASPGWQARSPLPQPRGHFAAAAVGGRLYALGGQVGHDAERRDVGRVDAYDPATDRWGARAPLPAPRSHADVSTIVVGGRIALFGGRNESPLPFWARGRPLEDFALRSAVLYDTEADAWSELPPLPVGLVAPSVGLVGERVIVVGGSVHMGAFPQDDTYALALRDLLGE